MDATEMVALVIAVVMVTWLFWPPRPSRYTGRRPSRYGYDD